MVGPRDGEGGAMQDRETAVAAGAAREIGVKLTRSGMPPWQVNLLRITVGLVILGSWEVASGRWIEEVFVSRPTQVVARLYELFFVTGAIYTHLRVTITEIAVGYAIGSAVGLIVGYFLGRSRVLTDIFEPYILAFYSIPKIALAPLFIIWLGIGIGSKIAVVILSAFFLVFFNTFAGMRNINEDFVNLARVMGANERQVTRRVILPSAAPFIIIGLKTAVPYSVIGAIIGEFIASSRGLGFYILYSASTFDSAGLFAGIFILVALVFTVNQCLNWLEAYILRWKPTEETKVTV